MPGTPHVSILLKAHSLPRKNSYLLNKANAFSSCTNPPCASPQLDACLLRIWTSTECTVLIPFCRLHTNTYCLPVYQIIIACVMYSVHKKQLSCPTALVLRRCMNTCIHTYIHTCANTAHLHPSYLVRQLWLMCIHACLHTQARSHLSDLAQQRLASWDTAYILRTLVLTLTTCSMQACLTFLSRMHVCMCLYVHVVKTWFAGSMHAWFAIVCMYVLLCIHTIHIQMHAHTLPTRGGSHVYASAYAYICMMYTRLHLFAWHITYIYKCMHIRYPQVKALMSIFVWCICVCIYLFGPQHTFYTYTHAWGLDTSRKLLAVSLHTRHYAYKHSHWISSKADLVHHPPAHKTTWRCQCVPAWRLHTYSSRLADFVQ
jgi:hypothetical protein